jgi:hypothetical protein
VGGLAYSTKGSMFAPASVVDPDSVGFLNPYPDTDSQSGSKSGSRTAKMAQKNRNLYCNKFHLVKCWMFSLRVKGFSCSLDVLYGGLGINKFQFLIKKRKQTNFVCIFFNLHSSQPSLDPYQDPDTFDVSEFNESGSTTLAPVAVFHICFIWNWIHAFLESRSLQT